MFNEDKSNRVSCFDSQMIRNRLVQNNIEYSPSFWSDDEDNDEFERLQYPYNPLNRIQTRIVWVTNYANNEDFPINVPAGDSLRDVVNTCLNTNETESFLPKEKDDVSLLSKINNLDLSTLNLDDLLLLLYRLQQQTTRMANTKNSVTASASTSSSSSSSFSSDFTERKHSLSPTLSNAVHSSFSMLNEIPAYQHPIYRRQSSFTLSNIADVPKQLTTTLAKPISSFHSQNTKHIHSPNDVVAKLLQSFHPHNSHIPTNCNKNDQKFVEHKPQRRSSLLPNYTYQQSQQHKAKVISNLFATSNPCFAHQNNPNHFYH